MNIDLSGRIALVTGATRDYSNCTADSAVAIENILLSAHSLGLGACYINQ